MRFASLLLVAAAAFAQNAPHIREWKPPAGEQSVAPKSTCSALHSLTGYDLSILSAESMPEANNVPAFCRVLVLVQPEIRIEVSLPVNWNRRLYMFGNGGYAGESLEAANRIAHRNAALGSGFAVTQTNTGHDAAKEPLATFTTNPQKFADYAFRSLHVTAESAKRVAAAYYGSRPVKSYYNGCSTGGRQGLILAQRYPDDFDGIIVGAPALDHFGGRLRSIATYQALQKAPLPVEKLKMLAEKVYAKCDAIDGLKDGLITDPRACDFRPSRDLPVCDAADSATCFTSGQIKTLENMYGDLVLNGKRVMYGWPVGAEIPGPNGTSGWDGWLVRANGLSQSANYAESALRYMIFPKPDPNYDMAKFNLERDAHLFNEVGRMMNATDPDLSRFRAHGGKILMYFGWADPALNPLMGIGYYESVLKKMGPGTHDFFQLYMMPGVFHCSGGVGPACFDPLVRIVPWVEKGVKPGAIIAEQIEKGKPVRSRPLCAYPQVAKYAGQGSPDVATSFKCAAP
ncbi:MAG: tannase/feruloyl esterase family alpha/beta hydrolase [Acidobacteria bacterium]|nr:tannase/feruloyl esterase family alpha/beta hydrolase [Acidobacteriota bacterium]